MLISLEYIIKYKNTVDDRHNNAKGIQKITHTSEHTNVLESRQLSAFLSRQLCLNATTLQCLKLY